MQTLPHITTYLSSELRSGFTTQFCGIGLMPPAVASAASSKHLHAFASVISSDHHSVVCRQQDENPTDWLMALPQSTLVTIMQRRCGIMCGVIRWGPSAPRKTFSLPTDEEMTQQEARISED